MTSSSPESIVGIISGQLRQKGVEIDEGVVWRLFAEINPGQRPTIFLDHSNVYEKVIAAFSWDACGPEGIRPILFVSDIPSYRLKLKECLSKIVSVMTATEMLPALTYPVIRERDSAYICLKRYNNAVTNGGIEAFVKEPALSIAEHRLLPQAANKICVKSCAVKYCAQAAVCRYAKLIASLRNGVSKLQIYPRKIYQVCFEAGEIPKRSIIIGASAPTLEMQKKTISYVLSERDFSDYSYLSVFHCDKSAGCKEHMSKLARRFKKLTRLLFDLLMSNRLNSRNLLKWLEELLECSNAIRQESMFTLTKDSKWMKLHNRISDAISCLLKADHPFEDIVIDHDKKTVTVTFPAHGKTNTISGVS